MLDEAYRRFSDPGLQPDVIRLLASYPNLLVQRTFSKDWALAGLRVGYALTSARLAHGPCNDAGRRTASMRSHWSAVEAALKNEWWRAMSVARVREERARLGARPRRWSAIEYFPSQANFVTAQLDLGGLGPALQALGDIVPLGDGPRDVWVGAYNRPVGPSDGVPAQDPVHLLGTDPIDDRENGDIDAEQAVRSGSSGVGER